MAVDWEKGSPVEKAVPRARVASVDVDGDEDVATGKLAVDAAASADGNLRAPREFVLNFGAEALVQQFVRSVGERQQ